MAKAKKSDPTPETVQTAQLPNTAALSSNELVQALVAAMTAVKPVEKKTEFNRKVNTPWTPKDGSKKLKLKRKMYQHGRTITAEMISNEEIALLNKVRPGVYFDGFVKVERRRDKGVNIDFPIGSAAQRLKLVNQFGIRNLKELLERIIDEGLKPRVEVVDEDDE